MHRKKTWLVTSIVPVVLGNFLYALTVKVFLLPAELASGGGTGLALAAHYLLGMSVSAVMLAVNVVTLLMGLAVLGWAFASTTLLSTFLMPAFMELCDRALGEFVLTKDPLLCCVFAGIGIGVSLGMVMRAGASTGGMDIPPLILNKYFRIPVSVGVYVCDTCIILLQASFHRAENILYGIIFLMIATIVLDKMMLIGTTRTEVKIVSRKTDEIRDAILRQLDRGVTMLDGEGGYLHDKTKVVFSVISNWELIKLEKIVYRIDPESFMVINRVSEVKGRGFSMEKRY